MRIIRQTCGINVGNDIKYYKEVEIEGLRIIHEYTQVEDYLGIKKFKLTQDFKSFDELPIDAREAIDAYERNKELRKCQKKLKQQIDSVVSRLTCKTAERVEKICSMKAKDFGW